MCNFMRVSEVTPLFIFFFFYNIAKSNFGEKVLLQVLDNLIFFVLFSYLHADSINGVDIKFVGMK
jgi:hypothetical protein